MKVPAQCPGEQTKEEKKQLKAERQHAATTLKSPTGPGRSTDNVSELPNMSRSNTMNSLSSGYAASAHRSVSGAPKSPLEESAPAPVAKTSISGPTTLRKNRVIAPPPTAYVSELPGSMPVSTNGNSLSAKEQQQSGKMLYAYDGTGPGELSVAEGTNVVILEPDGNSPSTLPSISTNKNS